jgi:hypothetical protein
MSLSDIYSNQVKHNPINRFTSSFGGMPQIEKDSTIKKLTDDVFAQIAELDKKDNPTPEPIMANSPELKTFDFAAAIKELLELQKNK